MKTLLFRQLNLDIIM